MASSTCGPATPATAQLAWSSDHARTWTWCDWRFETSFGCPTFLNFGQNYAGARDDFVYVYSPDGDSAYQAADRMVLARVPKDRITERDAYEFFAGHEPGRRSRSGPATSPAAQCGLRSSRGCGRSAISYDAGLERYLWCQTLPGGDARFRGGFGIYDAPEPWGPWTTVVLHRRLGRRAGRDVQPPHEVDERRRPNRSTSSSPATMLSRSAKPP